MIFAALLGVIALIAAVQVLRWYSETDVKTVKRALSWVAIALLALVAVFLAVTGRLAAAAALLAGLMAWAWRIMQMIHIGRQFGGMFRSFGFGRGAGAAGQSSEVTSRFLLMRLDHATGAIDGEVRAGRFAGRGLRDLSRDDLLALLAEVQGDVDSISLLEAYLDRVHPDWRATGEAQSGGNPAPSPSTMTADEAYRILGLPPDADEAAIRAAYRRLMAQLHPDRGGSDYLAAKVNQAKDLLLKKRGRS